MDYQDTPTASKNNAFCWRTWEPRITWRPNAQEEGGKTRSKQIEAMRAAGVEPGFVPNLQRSTRQNPLDAARVVIATAKHGARRG